MTNTDRIGAEIVQFIERWDGPATFLDIERQVRGFRADELPVRTLTLDANENGRMILWDGMTNAGSEALQKILCDQMVAIQYVNVLPYLLEGFLLSRDNWLPAMLLPARGANLKVGQYLMRASSRYQDYANKRATAEGRPAYCVVLHPSPIRFTADQFAI